MTRCNEENVEHKSPAFSLTVRPCHGFPLLRYPAHRPDPGQLQGTLHHFVRPLRKCQILSVRKWAASPCKADGLQIEGSFSLTSLARSISRWHFLLSFEKCPLWSAMPSAAGLHYIMSFPCTLSCQPLLAWVLLELTIRFGKRCHHNCHLIHL